MKALPAVLCCFLAPVMMFAQEEVELTKETMAEGVRANLAAYDVIAPPKADNPVTVRIKLGETTSKYRDKIVFDGFRITAPDDVAERDFVWYFNAPQNWANWFIVPVSGDFEGGFRNWLNADKLYLDLDKPQEKDRMRALQTLDSSYFRPGADYILWFRQISPDDGGTADLRAVYRFVARPADEKEWDRDSIEKVLKLKNATPADQVAEWNSRGGRILLDAALFDPSDASSRIRDVLFSIRQTTYHSGGVYVSVESSCRPCRRTPTLAAIVKKYGAADFVESAAELKKVEQHAGITGRKEDDVPVSTHYYDYFSFVVAEADPEGKVLEVKTHSSDFSRLKPPATGGFYGTMPTRNLTVLYQDGKEVGRFYFFAEGAREPLCIQEPPVGKYQNDDATLEYLGDGSWLMLNTEDGKLLRRTPFARNQMNGLMEGFYPDGKPSFKAPYKNGRLHGELIQYTEDGKVSDQRHFIDGQRVQDDEKKAPRKGPAKPADPKVKPKAL